MIVSLIAAMADNRVIGRANAIPWDVPADRRRFREITWGHPVIFGRKTFESIGHPLPGRQNIVISRQADYRAEGCLVVHDLRAALDACAGSDELFVCGGAEIYREALPLAQRVYLTVVHGEAEGEVLFPELRSGEFAVVECLERPGNEPLTFMVYERRRPASS